MPIAKPLGCPWQEKPTAHAHLCGSGANTSRKNGLARRPPSARKVLPRSFLLLCSYVCPFLPSAGRRRSSHNLGPDRHFQIVVLECRCHSVHLGLADAVPSGFVAPPRYGFSNFGSDFFSCGFIQVEIPRDIHRERKRRRVVVLVDC